MWRIVEANSRRQEMWKIKRHDVKKRWVQKKRRKKRADETVSNDWWTIICSALKSQMGVALDIPAIKAAVKWRYEDSVPCDISGGGHPRHAKTFRAGHGMTSAPSMGHGHYVTNTDHTSAANRAQAWSISSGTSAKGMKTNPPIHPSPTNPCSPQCTVDINIVSFLFCQGQFSLPLKSTPSREERKYSAACLNRTPDHDNNMDWEEIQDGFMHHQQKTECFRPSRILRLPSHDKLSTEMKL